MTEACWDVHNNGPARDSRDAHVKSLDDVQVFGTSYHIDQVKYVVLHVLTDEPLNHHQVFILGKLWNAHIIEPISVTHKKLGDFEMTLG